MSQRLHIDTDTLARLAANERAHRRQQKRIMVILAITVALGVGGVLYAVNELGKTQPAKVAIDPAKLPPIRPGPPQ
jgi:hypothetical protein